VVVVLKWTLTGAQRSNIITPEAAEELVEAGPTAETSQQIFNLCFYFPKRDLEKASKC
jgi:hypothetical protein